MATQLSCRGPLVTSFLIACLIALELARAGYGLLGPGWAQTVVPPAADLRLQAAEKRGVNVAMVAAAHLFGAAPEAPRAPDAIIRSTDSKLVLTGTFATGDPARGKAIIAADGAASNVYAVGQNVAGAMLDSVYSDHVLLRRNGQLESLAFPKLMSGVPHARLAQLSPKAVSEAESSPADDSEHHLQSLGEMAQLTPTSMGGKRGYRVYSSKDPDALRAAGLMRGDLVTAINGASLQDQPPDVAQQMLNSVQQAGMAVTVMRNGRSTVVNLNQ
ncbi:MAG: type II secretion system protein N [Steroidobacteraceae bacterium]